LGSTAIYFGYRVLQALLLPALLVYFAVRVMRNRRYWDNARQRLGFLPREYQQTSGGAIWFHAVSVGEVIMVCPLVARVRELLPDIPVFVSVTTLAGFATARDKLGTRVVGVFFVPVDYVWAVRRVLRRIRPSVLVVAETEIWPNLFRETRRAGAELLLVNGRISDRAAPKYLRWRWFFAAALAEVSLVLAQSDAMRERFIRSGAPAKRVQTAGNLKYDIEPIMPIGSPVTKFFEGSKVWVAASTSADGELAEEDAVLRAFGKVTGWKLLLAPRKPERFREVAQKLDGAGVAWVRRTELQDESRGDVLLLDTVGELAGLFVLADAVFMGGSLARAGGHNLLEPAWFAKPVTVGPHLENFREIAQQFRAANAFREIAGPAELTPYLDAAMGLRARECAMRNRGATELAAKQIAAFHAGALPCPSRSLPVRILLKPFSQIWKLGGDSRRSRALQNQQKLSVPVISVGNITVGGTGKTPVVLHLAQRLAQRGWHAGVLTRGYGRASPHQTMIVPRGGEASRSSTGDEPQMLLRSGAVALGIGANRVETGRELVRQGLADVLFLDDGFQHLQLARDFDLVLIDALAPFGSCELVPLGRLREPLRELQRASAFLITRAEPDFVTAPIEAQIRRFHPNAKIFRSRPVAESWIELGSEQSFRPTELPVARTLAFCGLGNPQSFWSTLRNLGIEPVDSLEYGDHHLYTPREVLRLGKVGREHKAEALLTTEKDLMNLCELTAEAIQPLRLFALRIGIEIEREQEFLETVMNAI